MVRHFAEDLGYEYMQAFNKGEYLINIDRFLTSDITDKPMLFEVFTNNEDESSALKLMNTLIEDFSPQLKQIAKNLIPNSIKKVIKNK